MIIRMPQWTIRGLLSPAGSASNASTLVKPAIAPFQGEIYCLFLGHDSHLYWTHWNGTSWAWSQAFGDPRASGYPSLGVYDGELHALINVINSRGQSRERDLLHYRFNVTANKWEALNYAPRMRSAGPATLIDHNGRLCCIYNFADAAERRLEIATWTAASAWKFQARLNDHWTHGELSVFPLQRELRVLYVSKNATRKIKQIRLDQNWNVVEEAPPADSSCFSLSASSIDQYGQGLAFMVFQANTDTGEIGVCTHSNGHWQPQQCPNVFSISTPAITTLNDRVVMVWNESNTSNLAWADAQAVADFSLETWMDRLQNDNQPLSNFSIPGTHESCSITWAPFVSCQTLSITQQLNSGIRAFDFRLGISEANVLQLYHGKVFLDFTFDQVLAELTTWLDTHQTEALIVQIKNEGSPSPPNVNFPTEVYNKITAAGNWVLGYRIPKLRDIKGKIQLLRRFPNLPIPTKQFGIDVTPWPDNRSGPLHRSGLVQDIWVQDLYEPLTSSSESAILDEKYAEIQKHLYNARTNTTAGRWFLHYISASKIVSVYLLSPWKFARGLYVFDDLSDTYLKGMNERTLDCLRNVQGPATYGVIMQDFTEIKPELNMNIICSNQLR